MEVWQMTREELQALSTLVFPIGASDGHYLMSDVDADKHFLSETEFEHRDEILEALGYPMGSIHEFAYGPGGDGLHSYRVVGVKRTLCLDPRDTTIYYGLPIYQVRLEFHQELTPNNFWAKRATSNPDRIERLDSPCDTLWGCKRLDVSSYDYRLRTAVREGKSIPQNVIDAYNSRNTARLEDTKPLWSAS